jgi:hypothetical protein
MWIGIVVPVAVVLSAALFAHVINRSEESESDSEWWWRIR